MTSIDINADLGESFGAWRMGDDAALLRVVSSANIACGFHAGDPQTMLATVELAVQNGVRIGAHPGYRDLQGFGRRAIAVPAKELYADVLYQVAALDGVARAAGGSVDYVKPHGALYNTIAHDAEQAAAVAHAVKDFGSLAVMGPASEDSMIVAACAELEVPYIPEAFADRGYSADGTLLPRSQRGAVITSAQEVAQRAVKIASEHSVTAATGEEVQLRAHSLCLHGDTPGAVELAGSVRSALEGVGIRVASRRGKH